MLEEFTPCLDVVIDKAILFINALRVTKFDFTLRRIHMTAKWRETAEI